MTVFYSYIIFEYLTRRYKDTYAFMHIGHIITMHTRLSIPISLFECYSKVLPAALGTCTLYTCTVYIVRGVSRDTTQAFSGWHAATQYSSQRRHTSWCAHLVLLGALIGSCMWVG